MASAIDEKGGRFKLEVPLDASGIEEFTPDMPLKVALLGSGNEVLASESVELDATGRGRAVFGLSARPGALRVVVGPGDADDEDLPRLQTISRGISARALRGSAVELAPIAISHYYWRWWRRWCRTFTITGRVVCPDGSPVPGASVCAYDVDWWWWWSSWQQVGCATTDASGSFAMRFRWCCGWWPWWWWRLRHWQLEPLLVDRIQPILRRLPHLQVPPPSPRPSLAVFESILAEGGVGHGAVHAEIDPAILPGLRDRLLTRLPAELELQRLRIWPWWPWQPWWDCTPDIRFRVKQECQGVERVIVDEGFWSVRWDIPTHLDVTLTADQDACCIHEPPPPEGNCVVIASVCNDLLDQIGGNPGAVAAPVGYLNPGAMAFSGDRAYAGTATIAGVFGDATNVDYYEFEWANGPAGPWNTMPPAAAGGFRRSFYGPALPPSPPGPSVVHHVDFPFQPIGGRLVIESREHFQEENENPSWGNSRFWIENRDLLMQWHTATTIADDTYHLRLLGYELVSPNTLGPVQILPLCNTNQDNGLALTIDNATSNLEPASDVVDVRINGASAGPCSNVDASGGGVLEVDFVAYDVDRHLAFYSLIATYGKNLAVDLLNAPGASLAAVPLASVAFGAIPAADFVGPDYGAARGQGAAAPHWRAGGLRLTIPDLRDAFPETCCYQLELRVYKRPVVSCDHGFAPYLSYYSLTVVV